MKLFGGNDSKNNATTPAPWSGKPKKKNRMLRGFIIAMCVIFLLAAGALLYFKLSTKAPEIIENSRSEDDLAEADSVSASHREGVHTLLVVGADQEGLNTDTMMVLQYDAINNTANVVSLPRDTMVNFDKVKKLNAIFFNEGGIEALLDDVKDLCGFRPDHYIMVDTNCFINVVDATGGVYFDVPQDMFYEDFSDHDDDGICEYIFQIDVKKGYQLLDGHDALGVFRYREGYGMGDIQRLGVQHDLLMAAAEQFMSSRNLLELYQAASIILHDSETDLTIGNLQWYAQQFLRMDISDIYISTMPVTGTWVRRLTYLVANVDDWIDMLNKTINPLTQDITREDCSIVYWIVAPTLKGNQYYSEVNDFATTDGTVVKMNFPWGPTEGL